MFYFGVLHPVARTLSRLLEDPSLATTLKGVYFIFYIFCRYMFLLLLCIAPEDGQQRPKHVAAKYMKYKINSL
jgi:hypothetical protein